MSAGDVRVSAEDRRQVQTDINGVRYTAQRGFGSFFTTCSRCGEPCTREAL